MNYLPIIVLIAIAVPSIKILYLRDDIHSTNLTIKTIGHQWYWRYEYSDFNNFDSFIIPTFQLKLNEFRLLEVDNQCILPLDYNIRIITTSIDVIRYEQSLP
jgi:cytochrome c oxidase subunit 2